MNDEEIFLHDLSNPIGTIFLVTHSLLTKAQASSDPNANHLNQLETISRCLDRIQKLLQERKRHIKTSPNS